MVVAKNLSQALLNSLEEAHIIPLSLGTKTYCPTINLKSMWEFDEDTSLINHIFAAKQIKKNDILTLENVKIRQFNAIAIKLRRSSKSCYEHWMTFIVPVLKTHVKKLPINNY